MKQEIVARLLVDVDDSTRYLVIVRKSVFREDGTIERKFCLTIDGDWVEVPEEQAYPPESFLPVSYTRASGEVFDQMAELARAIKKE